MRSPLAILAVIASLAAAASAARAGEAAGCAAHPKTEPARAVTRVIDAETILLDDGSEVRLIGTLAPRRPLTALADAPWPAEQDAIAALTRLVLGQSVDVVAAGRTMDRYGRHLAQVFVLRAGMRTWVQEELLSLGHARAYAIQGSTACLGELLARERAARAAGLGLWTNGAYAVRPALRSRELMRLRSTFQLVEGRVTAVAEVKGSIYLNFGTDWRNDFTAGVLRRGRKTATDAPAFDAKTLQGKRVRVRGWIERRNGPFIAIADLRQIEILDGTVPVAPPVAADAVREPKEKRPALLPGALDL